MKLTQENTARKRHTKSGHITIAVCHIVLVPILSFLLYLCGCPFSRIFHTPCPGCGMSRAYIALLRFDIAAAFGYHPLFFLGLPLILYVTHRNVLKRRLTAQAEGWIFGAVGVLFAVVFVVRLLMGGLPD